MSVDEIWLKKMMRISHKTHPSSIYIDIKKPYQLKKEEEYEISTR